MSPETLNLSADYPRKLYSFITRDYARPYMYTWKYRRYSPFNSWKVYPLIWIQNRGHSPHRWPLSDDNMGTLQPLTLLVIQNLRIERVIFYSSLTYLMPSHLKWKLSSPSRVEKVWAGAVKRFPCLLALFFDKFKVTSSHDGLPGILFNRPLIHLSLQIKLSRFPEWKQTWDLQECQAKRSLFTLSSLHKSSMWDPLVSWSPQHPSWNRTVLLKSNHEGERLVLNDFNAASSSRGWETACEKQQFYISRAGWN